MIRYGVVVIFCDYIWLMVHLEASFIDWVGFGSVLAALGVGKILWDVYDRWQKRRDEDRKSRGSWSDYHKNYSMVYGCLTDILKHTDADRVLIIENKNGGGKPHLNSTIYGTVKHEVFQGTLGSMSEDWKDQVLDREYLEMLREMDKEGFLYITLNDLDDGILKALYFNQSILGSRIYRLSDKFDRYIYMVANYCTALDVGGKADDVFRRNVNTLQRLYDSE